MAASIMPRIIGHAEVAAVLTFADLIPAIEKAHATFSRRNDKCGEDGNEQNQSGVFPQRTMMPISQHEGVAYIMPVYSVADDIVATKIVTNYKNNMEKHNIPSHLANIILNDSKTGMIKAIIDGDHVTGMRTAAASAVATKYLAREGADTLAILGAGSQAEYHLKALRHILKLKEIRVWTRSFEKAKAFAEKFDVVACETAKEAVKDADVIASCTSAQTPVLEAGWLKEGVHINGVGACVPWAQELGSEVMRSAVVYSDSTPGALQESGDVIHSKVEIFGEIGEVINGKVEAMRNKTTVYKSLGLAIQDAAASRIVLDKVVGREKAT
ncbi:ketimine reductase mu-crystallin-like [Diadema antillarum]|uniref:ketimine reductase mu-crystallin-like n=1 Tax=Diadema antillarum TaxID=105358 RepID=UPI003A8B24F7